MKKNGQFDKESQSIAPKIALILDQNIDKNCPKIFQKNPQRFAEKISHKITPQVLPLALEAIENIGF